MVVAIILGILAGAVSYIPHLLVSVKARKIIVAGNTLGTLGWFVGAIAASFVILFAALVACKLIAADVVLPFAAAEVVTFIVVAIVFGLINNRGRK